MDREKKLFQLIELFEGIVHKYSRFEDMEIRFVDAGVPLFKSELHMIKCVREHPETNMTGLAAVQGVTKGAVSQLLAKLEKKNLITKANRNRKEQTIKLTLAGEKAYRAHEEFHKHHFEELLKSMKILPTSRINFIEFVFREIDRFYDVFWKRVNEENKPKR